MRQATRVPRELTTGPFSLADARRAGLTRWQVYSAPFRRLAPGVFVSSALPDGALMKIAGARLRLPAGGAFAGLTAAWLHGLDVSPCDPIEVLVPARSRISARDLWISRAQLDRCDVVDRRGMPVTSLRRTLSDLSHRLPLVDAVVIADMALHQGLVELGALDGRLVKFAEPAAESPMETRLRMLLLPRRLPRPQAQVSLKDDGGRFLGRADLYYPGHRLVLEYDGGTHRDRMVEDNHRQNSLLSAGYRMLRFTAHDVLRAPDAVAAQVREVLRRPKLTFPHK